MANILIAEDDVLINNLIKKNLCLVGHECTQVYDGEQTIKSASAFAYDLLILDVMLPEVSGFEVMAYVKNTPVIFVTAKGKLEDRLKGLRLGADDYIVKPFDIPELIERVNAVLRRTKKDMRFFDFDDVHIDFDSRKVYKSGEDVRLTPKEYDLFEALLRNRNIALSRDKLITLVWSMDYDGDDRTVDIHIRRLRKKLGLEKRLITVYKMGYRLEI